MTESISTLAALLEKAGTQWRAYDIGRRITKLDKTDFEQIELGNRPYPYPLMGHAHIAIQFWDKNATQDPYVWFLKFPIDEQSKLVLATRDHFAHLVLEAIGTQLTGDGADGKLDNNPYVFTPNANKLAAFNALMKVELKRPASKYYEMVEQYFDAPLVRDWQMLAVQGLADFAMRLEHGNNLAKLCEHWLALPAEVQSPLAAMLEHVTLPVSAAEFFYKAISQAIKDSNKALLVNSLRAISGASAKGLIKQAFNDVLSSPFKEDKDVLLILIGRMWSVLDDNSALFALLDAAANIDNGDFFAGVFGDLVAIPALRPQVLGILRAPSRSDILSRAIGKLFSA